MSDKTRGKRASFLQLFQIAGKNIRRNKRRNVLSIVSVIVATVGTAIPFSFMLGIVSSLVDNTRRYVSGEVRIEHVDYEKYEDLNPLHLRVQNPEELKKVVKQISPESLVMGRIEMPVTHYVDGQGLLSNRYKLIGIDFPKEASVFSYTLIEGRVPDPEARELLLGAEASIKHHLKVGDKMTLMGQTMRRATNAVTFTISGIVGYPMGELNNNTLLSNFESVQRLAKIDGPSKLYIFTGDLDKSKQLSQTLNDKKLLGEGYVAKYLMDDSLLGAMTSRVKIVYGLFGLILLSLAGTILFNSSVMSIFERRKEIATLKALGMYDSEVKSIFFFESAILGVVGGTVGSVVALLVITPLHLYGLDLSVIWKSVSGIAIPTVLRPAMDAGVLISIYAIVIAMMSFVSYIPVQRITKISPIKALQEN